MGQYHFTPETYGELMAEEVPAYGAMHEAITRAIAEAQQLRVQRLCDLGIGTGETTLAALAALEHTPDEIVGVDVSPEMLAVARQRVPAARLLMQRLQDPLPRDGLFDLVVSALAVHHLDGAEKRALFAQLARVMTRGALLVLADVVLCDRPVDNPTPLSPDYDKPDRADNQLRWLADAGFRAELTWQAGDLVVIRAIRGHATTRDGSKRVRRAGG
ncbi:MAG: class I SAM-dependent methyltransferase [Myxococcales bacterium]|nr:class I SAM-dependent methyltransferase [Myxococcales bacterium]